MKNIRISLNDLIYAGDMRGIRQVIDDLGLKYSIAVPQTVYDEVWLFNCENVPNPLPFFIREITKPPRDLIGHGLSAADAEDVIGRSSYRAS